MSANIRDTSWTKHATGRQVPLKNKVLFVCLFCLFLFFRVRGGGGGGGSGYGGGDAWWEYHLVYKRNGPFLLENETNK